MKNFNHKGSFIFALIIFCLLSCKTQKQLLIRDEMNLNQFKLKDDLDFTDAIRRAMNSKAKVIFIPKGVYRIGATTGSRGCVFSFYGDKRAHSNKTFLFEEGAILKVSNHLPNKQTYDENCNVFVFENGRNNSLSNITFKNLTIDFSESSYKNPSNIFKHIAGVKIVTSRFRNRNSLRRNPIVKNITFINTKFIEGGGFTIYGGSNILVDKLDMFNPKIGLSVSTAEHFGLYEPDMKIKNVNIRFSKDYINSLHKKTSDQIYGFDFSEFQPKRTKTYKVDLDSMYIQNATFCKIQGYANLNLKNVTIDGGNPGGQACFKINDSDSVRLQNLIIKNRNHPKGNKVFEAWQSNFISIDNFTIDNCNLHGSSSLIWIHEDVVDIKANNLNLNSDNNCEYSLVSQSPKLEMNNVESNFIRLYKPASVDKIKKPAGKHNLKNKL